MHLIKFRLVTATMLLALCTLAAGAVVQAHAKVEKSEPADGATIAAAPASIQIWFSEAVDTKVSKIVLTGPSGAVKLGPAHSMAPRSLMAGIGGTLADGAYTIDWQTAGDDGHVVKGAPHFTIRHGE